MAAGFVAVPLALLAGHSAAAAPLAPPSAAPSATVAAHATRPPAARRIAEPRLSIAVSDGRASAKAGDRLSYVVSVRNAGTSEAPDLTITLALPSGVPLSSADRNGGPVDGKVTWHGSVRAGGTQGFAATGRVSRPPAQVLRLAAVACAAESGRNPIVCAADLDLSPAGAAAAAASSGRAAASAGDPAEAYAKVGGAAVAVVGVIALVITGRRNRLRRGARHLGGGQ
jgi:uncharacterized repeat protein (TIGR01451 family)